MCIHFIVLSWVVSGRQLLYGLNHNYAGIGQQSFNHAVQILDTMSKVLRSTYVYLEVVGVVTLLLTLQVPTLLICYPACMRKG